MSYLKGLLKSPDTSSRLSLEISVDLNPSREVEGDTITGNEFSILLVYNKLTYIIALEEVSKVSLDLTESTKQQIQEDVQNAFGTILEFDKLYGDTIRKAGYTLEAGQPRDTIDEGDLVSSLDIVVTSKGVSLKFDDEAHPVMEDRPELVEEIVNNLDIKQIAIDFVKSYLSGQNL
jgi:hypothetical protein